MTLSVDTINRDGDAFIRAFESAQECDRNPDARLGLHRAVVELVASGALLPHEAEEFEGTLISGQGRFLKQTCLKPSTE